MATTRKIGGHNFTAFLPVFAKNRCYYDRVDSLGIRNTPLIGYLISFSIRNFAGAFFVIGAKLAAFALKNIWR